MTRRPYIPDEVGTAAYPTHTQSRVGFSEKMEPVYGQVVEDLLTPEVRDALVPAAYKNAYGVTTSNAEQGAVTDKSGDALTSALGVLDKTVAAWRWDGFSVQLPSVLKEAVNMLSDLLDTLIGFMEAVKMLLEVAAAFAQGISDALKILIENLKTRIDEMLGLFTGKTGIYGIHIPLSIPAGADMAARIAYLKEVKVAVKTSAAKALTGVKLSPSEWPGRTLLSMVPSDTALSGNVGGTDGFIQTLEASLADSGDYNRPELGPNAWVGGYVVMYGGTDLTRLLTLWNKLKELFGNFFGKDPGPASPAAPAGVSAEVLAAKMTATRGVAPRVAVRWDRPRIRFSLTNFYPNWEPVADVVYAMRDPGTYTRSEATSALVRTQGFYSGTQPGISQSELAIYKADIWPGVHIDDTYTTEALGKTFVYRVGRRYKYATGNNTYAIDPATGQPGYIEVLSAPVRVLMPQDSKQGFSGTAPDWFSASLADILPPELIFLIEELKVVLKAMLDLITDVPGVIKEIIQNLIDEIQKWIDLAKRLKALLDLLLSILDIGAGAFAMGFFGLGGNDFLMNTLKSSITNAPSSGRKMSQVAADAPIGTKLEARLENASVTDVLSSAVVPDFGPSDSVGGFVLMAGDESMQAVQQTFKILQTLFGGGVKTGKSTQVLQKEVDDILTGVSRSVTGLTAQELLGVAPATDTYNLFTENMSGTADSAKKGDAC